MYKEIIDSKIMDAIRTHKQIEVLVYRAVKAAFQNYETAKNAKPLDDATELSIIKKMKIEREQDAKLYIDNSRNDLAEKELMEAEILAKMLPKGPSKDEIIKELSVYCFNKEWVTEHDDFSCSVFVPKKSMGEVIKHLKNIFPAADSKEISDLVKGCLSNE